ncbi:hypothetical protein E1B28_000996 [Marasmius oreades]|uniref:TM7S3/TM198-like domain-containing protein n=1 Tax=Marasmius oreades TaxID=181124 RepID=A0A9P7V2M8_9AGAR|nr:uncharacterized protein E1B28_000996 [Marasmius oreades]KAG7099123.1 hypothetical protein E1B28_000996 [Marasmius oreades]
MRPSLVPVSLGILSLFSSLIAAQSTTNTRTQSQTASSPTVTTSLSSGSVTITTSTTQNGRVSQFTTVVPTSANITITLSATPTSTGTPSVSATPDPILLDTKLDPAFGVLGAILIITGLPSAFWGHKNRWTSFFLIGFYTLSLVCFVLILKFGVLSAVNPPSKTVRGMFVLASSVAGIAGGAIAIFFWKAARYGIGGWGGFAVGLWVQCFHDGGLIKPIGFRWILYMGCAVVGFTLCTIPKIHYHVLLCSTAIVGASALMLGIDCFTTANLKEFYVWNLGFNELFTKFTSNGIQFPVTQVMQIELGLMGALTLIGISVQLRVLRVLQYKLREITVEQKQRDEEAEAQASSRLALLDRERDEWEKDHSMNKHGRQFSSLSTGTPLMKDHDGSASPTTPERRSDVTHVGDSRPRYHSGVSEFMAAPIPDQDLKRAARHTQGPGVLPALDLGWGLKEDVPDDFMAAGDGPKKPLSPEDAETLRRKEGLKAEIDSIRRSIEALKSGTPEPSSSLGSRRPSLTSRRTLSIDAGSALLPPHSSHARPPRERDPRARTHSMELLGQNAYGESISRPSSAPLRELEWDAYVQDRKLLQPPAGITAPIVTTPVNLPTTSSRIQVPPAVAEAINQRKRRESALGVGNGEPRNDSSEDIPLSDMMHHKRRSSTGGNIPVTILPPKKQIATPTPQRPPTHTKTFEELNERHREKMRDLQGPLTNAENEQAHLQAAKKRWERSKALEKEAVTKRQAEKAAQLEKRKRNEDETERLGGRQRSTFTGDSSRRHSRSLSADRLAALGTTSNNKRLSMLKVEDWQRYQQEVEPARPSRTGSGSGRDSRAFASESVPFPAGRGVHVRHKSRDPPS